jgi:hypothetical protein
VAAISPNRELPSAALIPPVRWTKAAAHGIQAICKKIECAAHAHVVSF